MFKFLYLLFYILCIYSCGQNNDVEKKEMTKIDVFIDKYNEVDFSKFKNSFIAIRQKDRDEVIYLIQKVNANQPGYFVTYNLHNNMITDINRDMLNKNGLKDYYTDEEIKNLVGLFRQYDFALLKVDSDNNVFINPFFIGEPALLLRMNMFNNDKEIRKGFLYTHYKKNWYIKN